jgi:phospholipid transport system substrate-binding protein
MQTITKKHMMPKKHLLKSILLSFVILFSVQVYAASNPTDMLQNMSDQLLGELKKTQNRNDQVLYSLLKKMLLPHVNLALMSQLIVGKYWADASAAQKSQFESEFTQFITRTYSTALSSYSHEKIRFFPVRQGASGNHVQVNSVIDQNNGGTVSVSYRLDLSAGEWKIYDFSVEGVSIVENYHSQFIDVLRSQGLATLIQQLHKQNAR